MIDKTPLPRAKRIDPEHVRVRAYFLWLHKHRDFPKWTDVDFWLTAEKTEKYFA